MKNKTKLPLLAATYLLILAFTSSCGGGSSSGGSSGTPAGGITGSDGLALTNVDSNDPVYLGLTGLDENAQYSVTVTAPSGESLSPDGGFLATTDEDGAIPTSTLVQDLNPAAGDASISLVVRGDFPTPRFAAEEGEYAVAVTNSSGTVVLQDTFTVIDDDKVFCSESDGTGRASFTSSETIFATIERGDDGDLADGTYSCYVVSDLGTPVENGDLLSGTATSVTVASGTGTASIGSFSSGQYDVICDVDADGSYDAGFDLRARPGRFRPCFTIQETNSGNDIIGQICSDRNGNYRDIFDPNATDSDIRDVFAWISPSEQSLVEHATGVRKYVVEHQSSWTDADSLTDVTGASNASSFEVDSVQGFCTNEAPWLVWPRERLAAGCYDCVIDVNANGVYDKGTDFVDNIDNSGDNTTCGMRVTSGSCADDSVEITSHTDDETVTSTAVTLEGTFAVEPAYASITIASGSQTTTIELTPSGTTFSANIPLFNGENLITVTAVDAENNGCAETITIVSSSSASSNELFRVQLTWDGDTDMDLHLVRPGGAYSNGGNGADDCNFGNCAVGLEGTITNFIDWGVSGEDDDPKLDVDCISCGNGIENIWINEIPEDGAYEVYVDAYSGSETAVNLSVFIRGATVGTVSCGAMVSDGSTDSCFVGTITWSGGDSGSGTFTPSGTKASNF